MNQGMVEVFLEIFKKACKSNCVILVNRDVNVDFLGDTGLTKTQAIKELCKSLSAKHYFKGPEKDRDTEHNGDVWIFKISLWDREVYVKLKYFTIKGQYCVKCLSFHD